MKKLIVKRKGTGWDMTAEEIYTAYHDSGMKLSIEFDSIRDKVMDKTSTSGKSGYKTGTVLGKMQNVELLILNDALQGSVEDLRNYMKWLKAQDDYPARVLYLETKYKKLTSDQLDEMQENVAYWRDSTLESFAIETLVKANHEVSDKAVKEVVALLKDNGYEEITEGINKGVYQYEKGIASKTKQKPSKK